MTKTVLITGISGFVGSKMAARMLTEDHEVIGITRRRADMKIPIKMEKELGDLMCNCFHLEYGDVTNFHSIATVIQKYQPDWIFHLASQSFVPESTRDPISTTETNALGTQNMLEATRLFSPKSKFIFAGSSEEYGLQFKDFDHWVRMKEKYGQIEPEFKLNNQMYGGGTELPINEQNVLRPLSPYAVSKVFGDFLCRNYHISFGLNTVVSRAFNHEGAGRGDHFVTSSIVSQLIDIKLGRSQTLKIGDMNVTRDWSHVEDIIDGYILLAEKAEPGSIYVQGTGVETSIDQFIFETQKQLNLYRIDDFEIVQDPALMRPSDVPNLQADPTKIRALGFKNRFTLKDIIRDQISYYMDRDNRKNTLNV